MLNEPNETHDLEVVPKDFKRRHQPQAEPKDHDHYYNPDPYNPNPYHC